ncbi:hypothetical protein [Desulfosporosinus sp. BG]|uniref:hypothetical protein n=1 Tax=Desulfosporosinus sp. BG TaxID=1633135 RepID=UPI00083B4681|nr:hypothetical protein [Desulfosporosinus sp. BG]
MANYRIKCTVKKISGNRQCCIGSAQVRLGEEYIIGSRTPENGMCGRAFHTIHLKVTAASLIQWFWADFISPTGYNQTPHRKSIGAGSGGVR